MRQVYALLGLTKRYGDERIEPACAQALAAEMHDVHRLERMVKLALPATPPTPALSPKVIPLPRARFLRPPSQFALPLASSEPDNRGEEKP